MHHGEHPGNPGADQRQHGAADGAGGPARRLRFGCAEHPAHRPSPSSTDAPDPIFRTPAWLITEANLSPKTLQTLDRYITARTQVYRVQVVGYFDSGGPSARVEVVIDTNQGNPRIVYYRDLTELGKGFDQAALTNGAR